jgi:hypothetical protein
MMSEFLRKEGESVWVLGRPHYSKQLCLSQARQIPQLPRGQEAPHLASAAPQLG